MSFDERRVYFMTGPRAADRALYAASWTTATKLISDLGYIVVYNDRATTLDVFQAVQHHLTWGVVCDGWRYHGTNVGHDSHGVGRRGVSGPGVSSKSNLKFFFSFAGASHALAFDWEQKVFGGRGRALGSPWPVRGYEAGASTAHETREARPIDPLHFPRLMAQLADVIRTRLPPNPNPPPRFESEMADRSKG
jgi:hypothetical protein